MVKPYMRRTYVRFEDLDGNELDRSEYAGHVSRTPIVLAAEKRLPTCRNVRFSYGTMKTGLPGDRWRFREVQCGI